MRVILLVKDYKSVGANKSAIAFLLFIKIKQTDAQQAAQAGEGEKVPCQL